MHKGGCRLWEATMDREIFAREISSKRKRLETLAQQIWENPEEPFQETIAARLVAELLEQEGFQVERGAGGVPTALRAVWGHGSPVIGLLGEYDSLPQMSQKATDHKEPMVENGYGHGCGHNLLAAATVGAALGMKAEMEERKLSGIWSWPWPGTQAGSTGHRLPGPVDAAESGFTIRAFPLMRRLIPGMEEALWMRSLC